MSTPARRSIFRESALRHHASRRTAAVAFSVPRPPFVFSGIALIALLALGAVVFLQFRVPSYVTGSVSVTRSDDGGGGKALVVRVSREWRSSVRVGQAVLIRLAASTVVARTQISRLDSDVAFLEWPETNGSDAAFPLGARYRADVEVGRETVFSEIPLVNGIG
jgi:hypothetical protein